LGLWAGRDLKLFAGLGHTRLSGLEGASSFGGIALPEHPGCECCTSISTGSTCRQTTLMASSPTLGSFMCRPRISRACCNNCHAALTRLGCCFIFQSAGRTRKVGITALRAYPTTCGRGVRYKLSGAGFMEDRLKLTIVRQATPGTQRAGECVRSPPHVISTSADFLDLSVVSCRQLQPATRAGSSRSLSCLSANRSAVRSVVPDNCVRSARCRLGANAALGVRRKCVVSMWG